MSDRISPIQTQLLSILRDHRQNSADPGYPKFLDPYGGQLLDPRQIDGLPALYVDVPGQFEIDSADGGFDLLNVHGSPELVLFAENAASAEDTRSAIAELIDWTIEALKGQMLQLADGPVPLERISGRILTDYDKKIAASVLRVQLTSLEN